MAAEAVPRRGRYYPATPVTDAVPAWRKAVADHIARDAPHRWAERLLAQADGLEDADPVLALTMRACGRLIETLPLYDAPTVRRALLADRSAVLGLCATIDAGLTAGSASHAMLRALRRSIEALPVTLPPMAGIGDIMRSESDRMAIQVEDRQLAGRNTPSISNITIYRRRENLTGNVTALFDFRNLLRIF